MRNLKKSLSLVLALALVISSVFVGGLTATAALDLYTTLNTYDDESDITLGNSTYDKQPAIYASNDGTYTSFGSYGANIAQNPLNDEADNVVFFDRVKSKTNDWPAAVRIYKQGTDSAQTTFAAFKPKVNTTYEYEFKYYIKTAPTVSVDFQIRNTTTRMHGNQDAYCYKPERILTTAVTVAAGTSTEGWVTAKGKFTVGDSVNYLGLFLASTTSSEDYNTEIFIDNIRISECATLTVYNFDGKNDKTIYASEYTTLAELTVPEYDGYILTGVYSDAELTSKLVASDLAINYVDTGVYYGWAKLNPGEYYAGFETYKQDINGKSYDSATTSIVSGNTYAGGYNIKINAAANSLNSFELRDKTAFDTKAGTKYVISFRYRSTAAAKLYAGTALASDVPGTASGIQGADLPAAADWTAASIEVTLNKGQKQGYVPALMVQALTDAIVEFDHIYMTYPVEKTQNIEDKFIVSKDWYPSLALFDGISITEEETIDYWNGEVEVPADADGDGVYEIDNAEKLAYIVINGGTITLEDSTVIENGSFLLTEDIYLNDISEYDWLSNTKTSALRPWVSGDSFNGTIDGDYHTIYGLYYWYEYNCWGANVGGTGLISTVKNGDTATIKNLVIDCATLKGATNVGAFVGGNCESNVVMDSCIVGKNVYLTGYRPAAFVGGAAWQTTTITNSASYATTVLAPLSTSTTPTYEHASIGLISNYYLSGHKVTISNCFNANGPICSGTSSDIVATNCYESVAGAITSGVTTLTTEQMQGRKVLDFDGTMPFLNYKGNYWCATDTYPILSASIGMKVVEYDIWDGTQVEPANKGLGTEEDPILISTPEELSYVIYNGGGEDKHYKLTNDIYLNHPHMVNWATGEALPSYNLKKWKTNFASQGNFDGSNYSIYGLYLTDGKTTYIASASAAHNTSKYASGLFGHITAGKVLSVKDLGIDYSYTRYDNCVSPFIGRTQVGSTATFKNCYVGKDVAADGGVAGAFVGLVDKNATVTIENCYNLGNIFGKYETGLMGYSSWSGGVKVTFINSYNATGKLSDHVRGNDKATNCYETISSFASGATVLTADKMQGLDTLTNADQMPNLNKAADGSDSRIYTATKSFPILSPFEGKLYVKPVVEDEVKDEVVEDKTPETYEYWDGSKPYEVKSGSDIVNADSYAKVKAVLAETGEGTEENPYKITNGTDLYAVMAYGGEDGAYFQLQKDIYLNDLSKINWLTGSVANGYELNTWRPNVAFAGNIDGNGHTIYGLYYHDGKNDFGTAKSYACGFISKVGSGTVTVKDLGIDNCYFRYDSNTGAFVGSVYTTGNVSLSGCYAGQNVTLVGNYTGLVGFVQDTTATLSIDRSYSLANCNANSGAGLLGYSYWDDGASVTVSNSYNATGKITGVSRANQTYTNCYEAVDGPVNTGVTTITADNMKGKDVLTSSTKMAGLRMARAYVENKADFATANYNNFVYLPAGTILEEDFAPLFFDTRMAPMDADDVMFTDRMIRGAYVKFAKQPDVTKIHVPVSKAHRVAFGTAQELLNSGYYDIETEIISENLAGHNNAVNYLFITDPHFDTGNAIYTSNSAKQFALAIQMANEMDEIDFVCLGGDLTNGGYGTSEAWINGYYDDKKNFHKGINQYLEPIKNCTKPVFVLVGNHDDNAYGTFAAAKVVSPDQWQETIIDQFVNRELADGTVMDVVQDVDPLNSEKVNSKYYYYDLDAKNTRIICLNASDFPYEYDADGNFTLKVKNASATGEGKYYSGRNFWGYSDHQMKWLAEEALGNLPEDYNVIVLSHMAIRGQTNSNGSWQAYTNGTTLEAILNAYQEKKTYINETIGVTQAVDFSADTGRIMSYQHGHEHSTYDVYEGDSQVWRISSSTTNPHGGGLGGRIFNEEAGAIDVMSVTEGYVFKQALGHGDTAFYLNDSPVFEGDVTFDQITDIRDLVALRNYKLAELATAIVPDGDYAKIRKLLLGIA